MKKFNRLVEEYNDVQLAIDVKDIIISQLKNALKEELNAWYGYVIVQEWLTGTFRPDIVKLYEETAEDELKDHAYWIMRRINELGGTVEDISVSPATWISANHTYIAPTWIQIENGDNIIPILESLNTNIENEKGAIETYKTLIETAQSVKDWTTERKCKEILADEEEHLQLLQDFVNDIEEKCKACC